MLMYKGSSSKVEIEVNKGFYAIETINYTFNIFSMPLQYSCEDINKTGLCPSDATCLSTRTGLLCGSCIQNYSQNFGGPECITDDKCNSKLFSFLLLLLFACIQSCLLYGLNYYTMDYFQNEYNIKKVSIEEIKSNGISIKKDCKVSDGKNINVSTKKSVDNISSVYNSKN